MFAFSRHSAPLLACLLVCGSEGTANAVPIPTGSTINFAGQSTCNATPCTFGNVIVTGGTGAFSSFTFGTAATFFPVIYDPFTPQQLYTSTNALGQTASYVATSQLNRSTQTIAGLTSFSVTDNGIARLTGFDDTVGAYLLTANQNGSVQGSFSAIYAASAAPEPGTWAMTILGLGAAGFVMRRKRPVAIRVSHAV